MAQEHPVPPSIGVAIADADSRDRQVLHSLVEKAPGFFLCGEAEDGEALIRLAEEKHPRVIFLDAELPGKSGVECARSIQDMDPRTVFIFTAAKGEYMGDAFEVYAFDYLLNPFNESRVTQTLFRIRERLQGPPEPPMPPPGRPPRPGGGRLLLKGREESYVISMEDILLIQREDRTTVIYCKEGRRYMTTETLSETEARLSPDFFRCHKSYIINLNAISSIQPYGRWTYVVKLEGTDQDALITHEKYEELEKLFS